MRASGLEVLAWLSFAGGLFAAASCNRSSATADSASSGPSASARATKQPEPAGHPSVGSLAGLPPQVVRAFDAQPGFAALPKPKAGDWLDRFHEPGQTVLQFKSSDRLVPSAARHTVFVLPIGSFAKGESPALELLADYLRRFIGLDVQVLPALGDAKALRVRSRRHGGVEQLLSADLLDALRERVPENAYGLVGVTMTDLFPAPSWNYVFGEARFAERVGVYSFARYDPAFHHEPRGRDTEQRILERSLKVMAHEIGHMFGMAHCTAYRCLMNGSNSLEETDASPMHLCPVCLRKLHLAAKFTPAERYGALERFYAEHGFAAEARWVQGRLQYLQVGPERAPAP